MNLNTFDDIPIRCETICNGTRSEKKIEPAFSPVENPDLIGTLHHFPSVPSRFINPRNVEIWLPPDYDEDNANGYAVLYMHDGQNLFEPQKSYIGVDWGMDETMAVLCRKKEIRPTIVVGIWNTPQRLREYLPQQPFCDHQSQRAMSRVMKRYGGRPISDNYLRFLVYELKPFVDSRYRTDPHREMTFLMGSSMGGLISLYGICEYPQVFGGVGCLSTHWPIAHQLFSAYLKVRLPKPGQHKIYLDYGDEANSPAYRVSQKRVDHIIKGRGYEPGIDWLSYWSAGEPHSETAWRTRVQAPLRFLLRNGQRPSETTADAKGEVRDSKTHHSGWPATSSSRFQSKNRHQGYWEKVPCAGKSEKSVMREELIMDSQYLELFKQLIRLKTTHDAENRPEHDRCRDLLKAEAEKRGLKTKMISSDPYPSLLAGLDVETLTPPLMLSCHLDVVQAREEQFEPQIKDNRMIGRGASDMKFAVPVFFNVWERLEAGKEKILLVFTFDEEIGGNKGIRYLLDEVGLRPAVSFIPDGGDNFQIEAEEKGVFLFRVKTSGKSAHGSRPWLGENAIDKMLAIYSDLRKEFPYVHSPEQWTQTLSLGKITAGEAANKVPDACEASFDLRFVEGRRAEEIKDLVQKIVADRGEFEPYVVGDNFYLDMELWCSRLFQEAAERHLSHSMPIYRSEGASDARFFTKYKIPVIISKPVCAGHHSDHEWIDLESITTYENILLDFATQVINRNG